MSAFKDLVATDRESIFLNADMFADTHFVDGAEITCVIDNDDHAQRSPELGVNSADMRLFVMSDTIERKEAGDFIEIDDVMYVVVSWKDDMGMAEVAIAAAQ